MGKARFPEDRRGGSGRLTPERRERIWATVLRGIDLDDLGHGPSPRSGRPVPRRPRLWAATAAAVLLVVGGVAVAGRIGPESDRIIAGQGGGDPLPTMDVLAGRAAGQPAVAFGEPGNRYLHWVADRTLRPPGGAEALHAWSEEVWVAPDGTGRQRWVVEDPGSAAVAGVEEEDRTFLEPDTLRPFRLRMAALASLPGSPEALVDLVLSTVDASSDIALAVALVDLLSLPVAPPEARGAIVRALSARGFGVVTWAVDPLGRSGVALIGPGSPEMRVELVVDPHTVRPLSVSYGEVGDQIAGGVDEQFSGRWTTIYRGARTRPDLTPG